MKQKITDKLIKSLQGNGQANIKIYDTELTGFGVLCTKAGTRSFYLNFHIAGRERRYTIGRYPAWSVAAARERAKELKRSIDQGIDPLEDRNHLRGAPTVIAVWKEYQKVHLPTVSIRGQKDQTSIWETFILPRLGNIKLFDLTSNHTDSLHRYITDLGKPVRANRTLEILRKALNLAVRWGWIERNAATGFRRNPEVPRERYLSGEEIARVMAHLERMENRKAANAILLLALTGARRGEVLGARWDEFDLDLGVWTKPASRTKARRVHRVPISPLAIALLQQMRKEADDENPHLFPSNKGTPIPDINRPWKRLKVATDLRDLRIHDLRHTFASIAISNGTTLYEVGRLLGHSQPRTTQRYAHFMDDPLRSATQKVEDAIMRNGSN